MKQPRPPRKPVDPLEQILKDATRPQQDDIVIVDIRSGETEAIVVEQRRVMEWVEDPETGIRMPQLVTTVTHSVDDNGMPLQKKQQVGFCRFDHPVKAKSLSQCSHCGRGVCSHHRIEVGSRIYCRQGLCSMIGMVCRFLWTIYRLIRFCIRAVLGIPGGVDEDAQA